MTKLRVKCVPVAGIVKGIVMACLGFKNTGGMGGGGGGGRGISPQAFLGFKNTILTFVLEQQ